MRLPFSHMGNTKIKDGEQFNSRGFLLSEDIDTDRKNYFIKNNLFNKTNVLNELNDNKEVEIYYSKEVEDLWVEYEKNPLCLKTFDFIDRLLSVLFKLGDNINTIIYYQLNNNRFLSQSHLDYLTESYNLWAYETPRKVGQLSFIKILTLNKINEGKKNDILLNEVYHCLKTDPVEYLEKTFNATGYNYNYDLLLMLKIMFGK